MINKPFSSKAWVAILELGRDGIESKHCNTNTIMKKLHSWRNWIAQAILTNIGVSNVVVRPGMNSSCINGLDKSKNTSKMDLGSMGSEMSNAEPTISNPPFDD